MQGKCYFSSPFLQLSWERVAATAGVVARAAPQKHYDGCDLSSHSQMVVQCTRGPVGMEIQSVLPSPRWAERASLSNVYTGAPFPTLLLYHFLTFGSFPPSPGILTLYGHDPSWSSHYSLPHTSQVILYHLSCHENPNLSRGPLLQDSFKRCVQFA